MEVINKCCLATGVKELPQRWESKLNGREIILRECKHKNVSAFDHILEIKQLSLFIRRPRIIKILQIFIDFLAKFDL